MRPHACCRDERAALGQHRERGRGCGHTHGWAAVSAGRAIEADAPSGRWVAAPQTTPNPRGKGDAADLAQGAALGWRHGTRRGRRGGGHGQLVAALWPGWAAAPHDRWLSWRLLLADAADTAHGHAPISPLTLRPRGCEAMDRIDIGPLRVLGQIAIHDSELAVFTPSSCPSLRTQGPSSSSQQSARRPR
jgi:hypothetical protein